MGKLHEPQSIYQKLKSEHDHHRDLLERIAATQGDSPERRKLWNTFYYETSAHAAAEEVVFYTALMSDTDGQPDSRHAIAEHQELDEIMQELNDMEMSSPGWLTRFKTLKDRYEHHVEEEEEDIFPVARDVLGTDASGELAAAFEKQKQEECGRVDQKANEALQH